MEKPESQIRQVELGDVSLRTHSQMNYVGMSSLLILAVKFIMHTIQEFSYSTAAPKTLAVSEEVRLLLGITSDVADSTEFAEIFSGNAVTTDMDPHAMCYGGINLGIGPGNLVMVEQSI